MSRFKKAEKIVRTLLHYYFIVLDSRFYEVGRKEWLANCVNWVIYAVRPVAREVKTRCQRTKSPKIV